MDNKNLAIKLLELCGGNQNISEAECCMTRLRVIYKDKSKIDVEAIKKTEDVMGVVSGSNDIQIVLGPGKVAKVTDLFLAELSPENNEDWKNIKQEHKEKIKLGRFQNILKSISKIFVPLIPGIMAAGLLLGIAEILNSIIVTNNLSKEGVLAIIAIMLTILGQSCFGAMTIFVGINSAKVFKCATILGGMIGAIVMMEVVSDFAKILDQLVETSFNIDAAIYNDAFPEGSLLCAGKGGVIGVIIGVWILSKIEKFLRRIIPNTLDLIVTPLICFSLTGVMMLLIIMPTAGVISDSIAIFLNYLGTSNLIIVKAIYGFLLGALYLPLVLFGLHQGLYPFYTIEIQTMGYTMMICPQLMAGVAQVGAAVAILIKAKRINHQSLCKTIAGAIPAGILGIGEPLIYGMSLPIAIVFVPIGLAAGIAGIFIVIMGCQALSYGPSAILAISTMTPETMLPFASGELIAVILGFFFTWIIVRKKKIQQHKDNISSSKDDISDFNKLIRS